MADSRRPGAHVTGVVVRRPVGIVALLNLMHALHCAAPEVASVGSAPRSDLALA
jgi:hypothetical protein